MKKSNLGACLCLCGGVLAALWTSASMFRALHWPGGYWQMLIAACLTIVFACVVACWLGRSDSFAAIIAAKGKSAKNLRNTLIATSIVVICLSVGILFRVNHWPYGGAIVAYSSIVLAILFFLTGIFAYQVTKE